MKRIRMIQAAGGVFVGVLAAACSKSAPPPGNDPSPTTPTAQGASIREPETAAPLASAPSAAPAAPAATPHGAAIAVKLKNVQIFHPYAPSRSLPSVKDDGSFDTVSAYESSGRFGAGVVIEAENTGTDVLADASLTGTITFTGAQGEESCELEASRIGYDGPKFLAFVERASTEATGKWKNDSEHETESVWRPRERVRMYARNEKCDSIVLSDLGIKQIQGSIKVTAHRRFQVPALAEYDDTTHEITIDSGTVRIVDRKTKKVLVLGVGAIVDAEGTGGPQLKHVRLYKPVRVGDTDAVASEPLKFDLNPGALTLQIVKLPSLQLGYASGNLVIHEKDGAAVTEDLAKLGLSLDTVQRADLPEASPDVKVAQDELTAEVTAITMTHYADDPSIERGHRRLTVKWKASIDAPKIEARLGEKATGPQGERAFKSERAHVARLLPCDGITLVTNKTTRNAQNRSDASKSCAQLDFVEGTEFSLTYDLERYELPVALTYTVGKTKTFSPIANASLLKLDPR